MILDHYAEGGIVRQLSKDIKMCHPEASETDTQCCQTYDVTCRSTTF